MCRLSTDWLSLCTYISLLYIVVGGFWNWRCCCFFFQAEDGIRDLVRSRGLGDVYKRQWSPSDWARERPGVTRSGRPLTKIGMRFGVTSVNILSLIHI